MTRTAGQQNRSPGGKRKLFAMDDVVKEPPTNGAETSGSSRVKLEEEKGEPTPVEYMEVRTQNMEKVHSLSFLERNLVSKLSLLKEQEREVSYKRATLFEEYSKVLVHESNLMIEVLKVFEQKKDIAARTSELEEQLTRFIPDIDETEKKLKDTRWSIYMYLGSTITWFKECGKLRLTEAKLRGDKDLLEKNFQLEKDKCVEVQEALQLSEKKLEAEKGKLLCQKCMVETRNCLILPCMHFTYCTDCLQSHLEVSNTCPICTGSVTASLHIVCKLD